MKKDNIILVGMPGCGKTTIGLEVSKRLGLNFIDSDTSIEKKEGMKISDIFKNFGEEYFRQKETEFLLDLDCSSFLLSTGGGIIENEENIEILKRLGLVFYLEILPDDIFERIKNDTARPLLSVDNPLEALNNLYNRRCEKYLLSDYKINANREIFEITDEITEIYEKNNGSN